MPIIYKHTNFHLVSGISYLLGMYYSNICCNLFLLIELLLLISTRKYLFNFHGHSYKLPYNWISENGIYWHCGVEVSSGTFYIILMIKVLFFRAIS